MTVKEAQKEIVDFFELEMNNHCERKLYNILSSVERIINRRVVETKYVYVNVDKYSEPVNLEEEAERICKLYDITVEDLKSKKRNHEYVAARAHLVREMRLNKNIGTIKLAKFLNRDHSTIVHLTYESKADCLIRPLYKNKKINV